MRIIFYGGAGSVTGSNYMVESGNTRILVDCGLAQGSKYAEKENFEPFAYDPSSVQAVFVTHAHIDHTGKLPKLVRDGFKGKIYSTPPTRDFSELLLLDSEHVLLEEATRENLAPIYTGEDVESAMKCWEGISYHEPVQVGNFKITLYDAGHILGSATIKIEAEGKSIIFSGDLGNYPAPIIHQTENLPDVDYCVIESTYGARVHEDTGKREGELEEVIEETIKAGGVLMIPAFAMERTQELLYHFHELISQGRIPKVPVYIDSPLAIKLTIIYKKYEEYFNKETFNLVKSGEDILNFPGLHLTLTTEQSKEINNVKPPKVIVAGSGMSNGGRIKYHEMRYLPDPKSTILFVGYQASGTPGRAILEGAKTVRMSGADVKVRCKKRSITAYSAHADQPRLLAWLKPRSKTLKRVFVVQGEESSSEILAGKIKETLFLDAYVPKAREEIVI
ncbi:MAG: MBL fold metallo-hydrolase [Candidatus Liptonbacteria bacterium]|nr:MBL fold metallo-hydrolase [Candidatus Liptonbacteria bacterium]